MSDMSLLSRRAAPAVMRAGLAALTVLVVGVGTASLAATAASAADQPWQFEQVTPSDKGGGAVAGQDTFQTRPDGKLLIYTASSPFDSILTDSAPLNVRYLGVRNPAGGSWDGVGLDVPNRYPDAEPQNQSFSVSATSDNLEYAVVASSVALTPGAIEGGSNVYLRETRTRRLELIVATSSRSLAADMTVGAGSGTLVKFVADDGSSVLFSGRADAPLVAGAVGKAALYSWARGRGIRAESVLPGVSGDEVVTADKSVYQSETGPRNMRSTGAGMKRVYFGGWAPGTTGSGPDAPLYVREDGESKLVSFSRRAGASATPVPINTLESVSRDGRYAIFMIDAFAQQLTDEGAAAGGEFQWYRYDAVTESLTYLWSADGAATGQGIAGVAEASQDGRTIVFRSSEALAVGGVAGSPNVYLWRDGTYTHIATLDPGSSGSTNNDVSQQLSVNGRYVAFVDDSTSLAQRFGVDNQSTACAGPFGGTGPCDGVYVYDIEQDELRCASCRPDGAIPRGDAGFPGALGPGFKRMNAYNAQMVSDTGDVYFGAIDDLVAEDQNGANDVYRYRFDTGEQSLVSRARPGTSARLIDSSADGRTVFIATNDPISPRDTDTVNDIYMTGPDARAAAAVQDTVAAECEGADCREAASRGGVEPPRAATNGPGAPSDAPAQATARAKVRVVGVRLQGTRLRVTVKASTGGVVRVSGARLATTSRSVRGAGSVVLTARLSASARRALAKGRRVRVGVRASLSPPFGESHAVSVIRTVRK